MHGEAVWLIIGPEPGVGLVEVAEGLIMAFRQRGTAAVGLIPIDAECPYDDEHDLHSEAGARLWLASDEKPPPLVVAPYRFAAGSTPTSAATAAGLDLSLMDILATVEEAARFGEPVVMVGPPRADEPYVGDRTIWEVATATESRLVIVVDDATRGALAPMVERARSLDLATLTVGRTDQPIPEALHLPPTSTRQDAANHLAAALVA